MIFKEEKMSVEVQVPFHDPVPGYKIKADLDPHCWHKDPDLGSGFVRIESRHQNEIAWYFQIHGLYRATGASFSKAQAEFTTNVLRSDSAWAPAKFSLKISKLKYVSNPHVKETVKCSLYIFFLINFEIKL